MIHYRNLDRLTPIGYTPNFTTIDSTGFIPDTMDRPIRSAMWQMSPRTFWSFIDIFELFVLLNLIYRLMH